MRGSRYKSVINLHVFLSQMGDASLSESPEEEEDIDSPGPSRDSVSPLIPQQDPRTPTPDGWSGSPRKRTQTLPTFNCPLTGMAAKADALNRWSQIQESVEEKSGTLSEDIFKILDLRSSGSLFGGGEKKLVARRGSDNTSSSSACPQKPDSDPQPGVSQQKRVGNLTATNKPEQKTDSQLVER